MLHAARPERPTAAAAATPCPAASRVRFRPAMPAPAQQAGPPGPSADPLAALLADTARGDRQAFSRLYDLTAGRLFAMARGLLWSADAAEDVLQETFLRVWRSAHRYDPARGPAMAWLATVLRNRAFTAAAGRRRLAIADDDTALAGLTDDAPDPLELTLQSDRARRVKACLQRLGADERGAILLVYFEGLTHRELAARLGLPLGTAKSRVRRGLARLAPCLNDGEPADWRSLLAGEYALGSLQGGVRRAFERRRDRDARFCGPADLWESRLAALVETLPDIPPPPRLWRRLEAALPANADRRRSRLAHRIADGVAGFALAALLLALWEAFRHG